MFPTMGPNWRSLFPFMARVGMRVTASLCYAEKRKSTASAFLRRLRRPNLGHHHGRIRTRCEGAGRFPLGQVFESVRIRPQAIAISGFSDGASYALSVGLANGSLFPQIVAFSPGFMSPPEARQSLASLSHMEPKTAFYRSIVAAGSSHGDCSELGIR